MVHELSVSEARRKLPSLLKAIQKDANLCFKIRVREETVATLASAKQMVKEGKAIQALMRLARKQEKLKRTKRSPISSENYKEHLYNTPNS